MRKFLARLSGASNKLFITGCKRSQLRGPERSSLDSQPSTRTSLETHTLTHKSTTPGARLGRTMEVTQSRHAPLSTRLRVYIRTPLLPNSPAPGPTAASMQTWPGSPPYPLIPGGSVRGRAWAGLGAFSRTVEAQTSCHPDPWDLRRLRVPAPPPKSLLGRFHLSTHPSQHSPVPHPLGQ